MFGRGVRLYYLSTQIWYYMVKKEYKCTPRKDMRRPMAALIAAMVKKERRSIGASSSLLDKYPTGVYYFGERKERRGINE